MQHPGRATRVLALAALLSAAPCVLAQNADLRREDQLKAAYLFNFVKFVEWPGTQNGQAITVCFAGGAAIHDALASGIEAKKVGNRPLAVRRLQAGDSPAGCSVLYMDSAVTGHRPVPLEGSPPVLTVSDLKGFSRNGGMIELFTESNRLRFNVNVDTAQKSGLRISSSLLQLAANVEKGGDK